MATAGAGLFQALLVSFLYFVPAISIHLLIGGLADGRKEGWEPNERAADWKRRYRHGAWWGRKLNLLLLGLFLIELVMFLVLRSAGCETMQSHTTAAAMNIAVIADRAFTLGFWILVALAVAAIPWAGLYLAEARRNGWADPRRHDYLVIHLLFIPLALILLYVTFGVVPGMICPT